MAERDIKYRGLKTFQIFSGETKSVWIYGFFLKRGTYGDPGPQAHIFVYENGYEGYRVEAETIGQFTGIFDNEGKEVYEDDIISFDGGKIGVVEFYRGCFVVKYGIENTTKYLYDVQNMDLKILGNICETPELLDKNSKNKRTSKRVKKFKVVENNPQREVG